MLDYGLSASVSYQWLVKNNTVFQQIVVKNRGTSSIDFWFGSDLPMLIRDLDYLGEPSYNERNSNSYIRGLGPNEFGWITANVISSEDSDTEPEDDKRGDQEIRASDSYHEPRQSYGPNEAKRPPTDDGLWRTRRISDTWSAKKTHAVVSIMSVFVDGTAEKMVKGPRRIDWDRTLGPGGSTSSVLEITVAYKMIAIPKEKLHWKNFLIPAGTADVTAMLAAETQQLWGHSVTEVCNCNPSLCDLGISLNGRNDQSMGPLATGNTAEIAPETSPVDSIEYLTWRHTEHILSVCTIPLSVPSLPHEVEEPKSDITCGTNTWSTPKCEELVLEAPLALTCGDMSGHRVCTSASL